MAKGQRQSTFTGPILFCSLSSNIEFQILLYWTNTFFTSHGSRTGVFHIDWPAITDSQPGVYM